jgi:F-type H+-transporting ATPase subunit b
MELLKNPEIWVLIGFSLFLILAFKPGKKALIGGLDTRIEKIKAQLQEAAALRAEAEAALKAAEQAQRDAAAEAEKLIARARADAAQSKAHALAEIGNLTARRQKEAIEKIAQAEAQALEEVRRLAADVAIAATAQVLTAHVTGKVADGIIDQAIAELPAAIH